MGELNNRQKIFVAEYLIDLNATQAAVRAGYSKHTAEVIGHENLRKPDIAAAIQGSMDKRSDKLEITAERILAEIAKLGFGNIQNLYDDDGTLQRVIDLPKDVTATIQEVTEETIGGGEATILRRKYKLADKKASLELLGKHLKLFSDRLDVNVIRSAKEYTDAELQNIINSGS